MTVSMRQLDLTDRNPLSKAISPSIISLDEDLIYFEKNQSGAIQIMDEQHTFRLEESLFTPNQDKGIPRVLTEDKNLLKHFLCIWIVERIVIRDVNILYYKQQSRLRTSKLHTSDEILDKFYKQIFMLDDLTEGEYRSEHFQCVMKVIYKYWSYRDVLLSLWDCPGAEFFIQHENLGHKYISIADFKNQMNLEVYKFLAGTKFRESIRTRNRRSTSQINRAKKYISILSDEFGSLKVIRLDLIVPARQNQNDPDFKHKFQIFTQKMRKSSLLELKGYIWKLVYSFAKSYQYHAIIFLSGSNPYPDSKLAQMIADMWDKSIDGKNCYFNCSSSKNLIHYKKIVVGNLEKNDHFKYEQLLNVYIRYFCKKDQFIRHKSLLNHKTFDTGRTFISRRYLGRPAINQFIKNN